MTTEVTQILKQLADGDKNAADALLPPSTSNYAASPDSG